MSPRRGQKRSFVGSTGFAGVAVAGAFGGCRGSLLGHPVRGALAVEDSAGGPDVAGGTPEPEAARAEGELLGLERAEAPLGAEPAPAGAIDDSGGGVAEEVGALRAPR